MKVFCVLVVVLAGVVMSIWPMPAQMTVTESGATVNLSSIVYKGNTSNDIIQQALQRYEKLNFPFGKKEGGMEYPIEVSFDREEPLSLQMDESYQIFLDPQGGRLHAATIWGVLRGLESLSQLINYMEDKYVIEGLPIDIKDAPRYPWRGFLIDTSRHFFPIEDLKRLIDAMSYNKFNVFHWHLVDAQTFPVVSEAYPKLSTMVWNRNAVYTQAAIRDIVRYAELRGIRVVPEFDTPGHFYSWGAGYPGFRAECPSYAHNVNNIPINPVRKGNMEMIAGIFKEMVGLFPDLYFHTGGDELVLGCWREDPEIKAYLHARGMTAVDLEQQYSHNITAILADLGRKSIFWQDPVVNGVKLPAGAVVEVWADAKKMKEIVRDGYDAIKAAGYYLDRQIPFDKTYYEWVDTWKSFYDNDPNMGIPAAQADKVLGAEMVMFTEQVDPVNMDSRIWPRSCGGAERFWSPASVNDAKAAVPRLSDMSCRMAQRGIGSGPIRPGYCPLPPS